jgi:hypothetical protein
MTYQRNSLRTEEEEEGEEKEKEEEETLLHLSNVQSHCCENFKSHTHHT